MFIIFLVSIVVLALLSDFLLCIKLFTTLKWRKIIVYRAVFLNTLLALPIFIVGREHFSINLVGWFIFLYLVNYIPQIIFALVNLFDIRNRIIKPTIIFALLLAIVMLYGATFGRLGIRVEEVNIVSPKITSQIDGYKIAQISDLHVGVFANHSRFFKRFVRKVNALDADMIVITGDIVHIKANELEHHYTYLAQLKAKDGVYVALGNHDYGDYHKWDSNEAKVENQRELVRYFNKMGWQLLDNSSTVIGDIKLIGVGNMGGKGFAEYGNLPLSLEGVDNSTYNILLCHSPVYWDEKIATTEVDLTLAGHIHAMQMKFNLFGCAFSPATLMYDKWSGLYREGDSYLYINDGIGAVGMPIRIGTRPEITLIELNK